MKYMQVLKHTKGNKKNSILTLAHKKKKKKTTEAGHGVRTQTGLVNGCDNKNHTMVKLQMHTGYGAKYYFIKDLGWYLVLIFVQIFNFIEFFQIAIDGQNLYPSLT